MKLVICNGEKYEVWQTGALLVRLQMRPGGAPIRAHGTRLVQDDEARAELRALLDSGAYDREF
jgi:hypothetical protein